MRALIVVAGCLGLMACTATGTVPNIPATSPAPLARTTIDKQAVVTAYKAFDAVLDTINLLRKAGVIKDGSAQALTIAGAVDRTNLALQAANRAIDAGEASSYSAALASANAGLDNLRSALAK